jgi:uncharacterized protein YdbL (DUF1318 family)
MLRALRFSLIAAGLALCAGPALAQDSVVEQARAAGLVGEQADGYLGLVSGSASADLKSRVDQINIKRRALYTESASQRGVTVDSMAAATACELLQSRVGPGQYYRDENGAWTKRNGSEPTKRPSFCGS